MLNNLVQWKTIGKIPAQKGYSENIGTAGLLQGVLDEKLVIGGGANFPNGSVVDGGQKVTHKDLYLIGDENDNLKVYDHIQLDYPIAYGSSTSSEDAIFYLGGSPEEKYSSSITKITLDGNKLKAELVGNLGMSLENAISEYVDGKIYFGIGNLDGKNTTDFYRYDLETGEKEALAKFPGEERNQCISCVFGNKIVVFGGGSNVAYTDGYAYDMENNTWEKISDIVIDGEEISILGAGAVKMNDKEVLVIGGFNKDLWKDAVHNLSTLQGEEKQAYRVKYFGQEPESYNWNKEMLIYNVENNSWRTEGQISFNAPCGNGLLKSGSNVYSIMGEIKPGTRTPNVYKVTF